MNDPFSGVFGDVFNQVFDERIWEERLTDYWVHCKGELYYKTLYDCKANGFRVMRNSDGKHKVEKR